MTRASLPVPPGFCLTAAAYLAFLKITGADVAIRQILEGMREDNLAEVDARSERIRACFTEREMPAEIAAQAVTAYHQLSQTLGRQAVPVAVRSSATAEDLPTASFAGQQDTYLNVRGDDDLLAHARQCWASLWTGRAVSYRIRQGFAHEQVALSVVVQAMIESEVAGIMFTANPVTGSRDEAVVNASWGLGESIVSGLVTPDTLTVRKSDGAIISRQIASKDILIQYAPQGGTVELPVPPEQRSTPALSDAQVAELVRLSGLIEAHYKRPMDIEWGFAGSRFYILQARPITTLKPAAAPAAPLPAAPDGSSSPFGVGGETASLSPAGRILTGRAEGPASPPAAALGHKGIDFRTGVPAGPVPQASPADALSARGTGRAGSRVPPGEYNRTMFIEIFPDPLSPIFLSVIQPLFDSMLAFTFETLGFKPPRDVPAIGAFFNQPYFSRAYIEAALQPLSPPVRAQLVAQIINPFGRHARGVRGELSPAFAGMVLRLLRFMVSFPAQLPGVVARYRHGINDFMALDLSTLSDREIVNRAMALGLNTAGALLNYDFLMIALIGITYQTLGTLLERYYGADSEEVRSKLISGVTGNVTMETNKRLWDLAQTAKRSPAVADALRHADVSTLRAQLAQSAESAAFLAELQRFLDEFGHREVRMDILYPTWGEDPAPVLAFLRGYLDVGDNQSPYHQQGRLVQQREELAASVRSHVRSDWRGRLLVWPVFAWVLKHTHAHTRERDTMHFELTRLFPALRGALLEVGRRWSAAGILAAPDDIFYLTMSELPLVADTRTPQHDLVRSRRAEFEANKLRPAPGILRDGQAVAVEGAAGPVAGGSSPDFRTAVPAGTGRAGSREPAGEILAAGQFRGIAGSPGTVTGTARLVRGPEDFAKLKSGEILIAPLTNPVWTPLFAIAGGLVTEIGGILSHGAIVAREYGLPAVMGVAGATSAIAEGRRVTVDGNRGIVTVEPEAVA
jgi:pyruvate,water dikinase